MNKKNTDNLNFYNLKKVITKSYIYEDKSDITNNKPTQSVTDKSHFRSNTINARDKAIAIANNGGGNIGLYDSELKNDKIAKQLAYLRKPERDITEVENGKKYIEQQIENKKEIDKENLENYEKSKKLENTLETIAKNTEKTSTETQEK